MKKDMCDRTYRTWWSMLQRCYNPNNDRYYSYGGIGIITDKKWLTIDGFLEDMGERPEGKTLDRIDNNKGYFKDNCRWATREEQQRNRRNTKITDSVAQRIKEFSLNNKDKSQREISRLLAKELGIKQETIREVLKRRVRKDLFI